MISWDWRLTLICGPYGFNSCRGNFNSREKYIFFRKYRTWLRSLQPSTSSSSSSSSSSTSTRWLDRSSSNLKVARSDLRLFLWRSWDEKFVRKKVRSWTLGLSDFYRIIIALSMWTSIEQISAWWDDRTLGKYFVLNVSRRMGSNPAEGNLQKAAI